MDMGTNPDDFKAMAQTTQMEKDMLIATCHYDSVVVLYGVFL